MTPREQIDLARRVVRGEQALQDAGFQRPNLAPALASWDAGGAAPQTFATINVSGAGTYSIVSGAAAQSIHVYALFVFSEAEQTLEFWNGADSLTGPMVKWPAQQGLLLPFVDEPYFELGAGNPFKVSISAAGQLSGWLKFRMV